MTSINNEQPAERNATFAHNLATLNKLVLVLFAQDKTVVPKESSWFGSEAIPDTDRKALYFQRGSQQQVLGSAQNEKQIIPMRLQPLYTEDWIGLRKLDERGGVVFETCAGEHMQLGDCWERLVREFAGAKSH